MYTMESLNKIEIRGRIGSINKTTIGDSQMAHFSVAVDDIYDNGGEKFVETTWFLVTAFEGEKIDLSLERGDEVYVSGRLRIREFTGADGVQRKSVEVIAREVR